MKDETAKRSELGDEQFHAIARALADPRRYAILEQIARVNDCTCGALNEQQVISRATISHHLKELAEAGLIRIEREGRLANLYFCRPVLKAYRKRLADL